MLVCIPPSWAENQKTYPTLTEIPETLKLTGHGTVKRIIDPLHIELNDGRIIYLTELDIPDLYGPETGDISFEGKKLLTELFQNETIHIYQLRHNTEARTNRMGHQVAHIARQEDDLWAQGALLRNGLARVRTTLTYRDLAKEMLTIENTAREVSLESTDNQNKEELPYSLWKNPEYQIHTPETALKAQHRYQVIEGKIKKVATVKNVIYLNFGDNWRTDFTVTLDSKARRLFSREGLSPLEWQGKTIRVRGWLDEYNGPYITLDHPERIEFIETEPASPSREMSTNPLKEPENALPKSF